MAKRRPRQPQKRKKETWQEYVKRDEAWHEQWGSANPTGYGPHSDLKGMRQRLTGKIITSPGDVFNADMFQPFNDRASIKCNAAGLAWLQRGQKSDPDGPKTCPYLGISCTHPAPNVTREVGAVIATKPMPTLQLRLFDQPQWELEYRPCCIEGVYRLSSKLKKMGYAVKIDLDKSNDIKHEYNVLFGLTPCLKEI